MADVQQLMNAVIETTEAVSYAEALVLDEELIGDDDYKLVMSNAYSGEYPPEKKYRTEV